MASKHNSKESKTYLIEGWLKKTKAKGSNHFFSNSTKRWFTLDIINATFNYANSKGKKASKTIPLRDIESLETDNEEGKNLKDWNYYFVVKTKDRSFHLNALNEPEREMWILAFDTLLKFRKGQHNEKKKEEEGAEGEGEGEESEPKEGGSEKESLAERLREKEEELARKIEEVDLYRNSKGKPKKKESKKKGKAEGEE